MGKTTHQQFEKPLSREQNLELFLQGMLDAIDASLGNTHISGLQLEWVGSNSVKVNPGAAWVGGYGTMRVAASITVAGISLGASAWGHVYLYGNAGVPTIEVVATAPSNYFGTAYQKTGNSTRRYLGSVRTDAGGNILAFWHDAGEEFMQYANAASASPNRVLAAGTATAETSVSCSAVVPVTAKRRVVGRMVNTAPNTSILFGASDDQITLNPDFLRLVGANADGQLMLAVDANQAFTYRMGAAPSSGGAYFDVYGYWFKR